MNIFYILLSPFYLLPSAGVKYLGSLLGRCYRMIDRRHYREVLQRIEMSLQKPSEESVKIAKAFYRHLGVLALEIMRLPLMNRVRIRKIVSDKNVDVLRGLLDQGKGCIIVTGHFGNWEYAGVAMAAYGLPICPVAKPLKKSRLNQFMNACREQTGATIISQQNAYREMLKALKQNKMVIMLLDYDTSPEKGGIFIPFFGKPAATVPTAALLHLKTNAPIVVTRLKRQADRIHFDVQIDQLIEGSAKESKEERIIDISTRINQSFEKFIVEAPEEWLWLQRRWRFDPSKLHNANSFEE